MEHSFNVDIAQKYGIEESVLVNNLYFWIRKNEANEKHFHDGRYWTYNTNKALSELFPYISESKMFRVLKHLEEEGIIIKGNYNREKFDRTCWYALTDKGLSLFNTPFQNEGMHFAEMKNADLQNEVTIPDNKHTDKKQKNKEDTKVCKKAKINWRADIEVYRKACEEAKDVLADDKEFEAIFLKSFPNADYYRSILKSLMYWESEKGWETKKKSRSVDINMVMTLKKNLDKSVVYKSAQDKPIQNERLLHIKVVDEEGTLADGTIFKEGHRYYYSEKYSRLCSIPVDAVERPDERWEWDNKKGWYLPEQKETIDDVLW